MICTNPECKRLIPDKSIFCDQCGVKIQIQSTSLKLHTDQLTNGNDRGRTCQSNQQKAISSHNEIIIQEKKISTNLIKKVTDSSLEYLKPHMIIISVLLGGDLVFSVITGLANFYTPNTNPLFTLFPPYFFISVIVSYFIYAYREIDPIKWIEPKNIGFFLAVVVFSQLIFSVNLIYVANWNFNLNSLGIGMMLFLTRQVLLWSSIFMVIRY